MPICKHTLKLLLISLVQVLSLLKFPQDFIEFLSQFGDSKVNFKRFDLFADLNQFDDIGCVSLDGFDSHIIVHSLLHEGGICKRLRILRDRQRIQFDQGRQVVQHISLVVAEVADGVVAVVGVEEGADFEIGKSI